MILAAALALLSVQNGEDGVGLGLRYLARHQASDGSWGARQAACRCPPEPLLPAPADPAVRDRVDALIRDLDDDDYQRREQAQQQILAIGAPAVPMLQEAVARGSVEVQWRAKAALRRIGIAGTSEDIESTAMALVAFLGAGYSHLSKDVRDELCFGVVVKEGFRWLIAREKEDGSFETTTVAGQAWAALALSEAFGMTASAIYRLPAQKAIDYLVAHPAADPRGLFYQGMALKSAELSELTFPRQAMERVTRALADKRADEPASVFARAATQVLEIFTWRDKRRLDLSGIPGVDPSRMEIETVYVVGLSLFQADGPHGPRWKAFNGEEKQRILAAQDHVHGKCGRGSWAAVGTRERLKTAALGTLSREIYYR